MAIGIKKPTFEELIKPSFEELVGQEEAPKTIFATPVPPEELIEPRQPFRVDLPGPQLPGGTPADLGPSEPLVRYQRQLEERQRKIQEAEALELFYKTHPEKRPRKYKHFVDELLRNTGGGVLNVASGLTGTLASVSEGAIWDPDQLEGWAQKLHQKAKEPAFTPAEGGGWRGFVAASIGQAAPYMAAAVGATILTGTPMGAFGVGYSVEGDNAYRDAIEAGASEEEAQMNRFIVGTINATIEAIQVSQVMKFAKTGKGSVAGIRKATQQRAWKKVLAKGGKVGYEAAKHSTREALEEVLQETTQIVAISKHDPKVWDTATQRILMSGLGGGTVGLLLGGGGRVMTNMRAKAEAGKLTPQQLEVMNQTKNEYDAIVAEGGIGSNQKAKEAIRKGQGKLAALEGEEAATAFEAEVAEMDAELRGIQRPPEPPIPAVEPTPAVRPLPPERISPPEAEIARPGEAVEAEKVAKPLKPQEVIAKKEKYTPAKPPVETKKELRKREIEAETEEAGISPTRRNRIVKETEKRIAESDIYQTQLEAVETKIDPGYYFVPEKFRSEVEDIIGKRKGFPTKVQAMFTFSPTEKKIVKTPEGQAEIGPTHWDIAVQEALGRGMEGIDETAGVMDISDFVQQVKDSVEAEEVGGLDKTALDRAAASGDPYLQYLITKAEMLRDGKAVTEIDEMTREWAEHFGLDQSEVENEFLGPEPLKIREIRQLPEEKQDEAIEALARENILKKERQEAKLAVNEVLKANDIEAEVEEVAEIEEGEEIPFERRGRPTGAAIITPAGKEIVQLAYGADSETGYHEAYHTLRRHLTPTDIKLLEHRFKGDAEAEAKEFAEYAKTGKVKVGWLRAVWRKLRDKLRKIKSALQGRGYRTAQDIFGEIQRGVVPKEYATAQEVAQYERREVTERKEPDYGLTGRSKKKFGTTTDLREAGYILPLGMLDFSGRHEATGYEKGKFQYKPKQGEPDYLRGTRNTDHRQVEGLGLKPGTSADQMIEFQERTKAARISYNPPGYLMVSTVGKPYPSVKRQILEKIKDYGITEVAIDIDDATGKTIYSTIIKDATVGKIRRWYSNPTQWAPGQVQYEYRGVFGQPIQEQLRLPLPERQAAIKKVAVQEAREKIAKRKAKPPKITDRIDKIAGVEKSYWKDQELTVYYDETIPKETINVRVHKTLTDNRLMDSVKKVNLLSTEKGSFKPYEEWRPKGVVPIKTALIKAVDAEITRTIKPRSNSVTITPEEIAARLGPPTGLFVEKQKGPRKADLFHNPDNPLPEITEAFNQLVKGGPLIQFETSGERMIRESMRNARIKAEKARLKTRVKPKKVSRARLKIKIRDVTPMLREDFKPEVTLDELVAEPRDIKPKQKIYLTDKWFQENIKPHRKKAATKPTSMASRSLKLLDKVLGSSSTRLYNIHPELFRQARRYSFDVMTRSTDMVAEAEPFLKAMRKMSKDDYKMFDLALKNGYERKIVELVGKYGLEKEYSVVRGVLDDLYNAAKEVGIDMEYRKEYWHRHLKDPQGFLEYFQKGDDWSIIEEAIKRRAERAGRTIDELTDEEKAQVVNTLLRGYRIEALTLARPGAAKARTVEVIDADLNQFYDDSASAMVKYIRLMNRKIAEREFFGRETKEITDLRKLQSTRLTRLLKLQRRRGMKEGTAEGAYKEHISKTAENWKAGQERLQRLTNASPENTIGGYVMDLQRTGQIKPSQEKELRDILQGIFYPRGMGRGMGLFATGVYIDTLNSPLQALTQLDEFAYSFYRSPTKSVPVAIRTALRKSKITPRDIGITSIGVEFQGPSMQRALSLMLKSTGFEQIDRLNKENYINTVLAKMQAQARKKTPSAPLVKRLVRVFGKDYKNVLEDLRKPIRSLEDVSDDVKYLLFNDLLDIQPVAITEMPEAYNKAGNMRILYALKTFYMKRLDFIRTECWKDMKSPKTFARGFGKLTWLAFSFALFGAVSDALKDFIKGRKFDLKDSVCDNMLRMVFSSKFQVAQITKEGAGRAHLEQWVPPTKAIDAVSKDVVNVAKGKDRGFELWRSVPLVGEFYYWWFGRGREKIEAREEKGWSEATE